MSDFEKPAPKELEEIADLRRGRDYNKIREKMIKETEEGIEKLIKEDQESQGQEK